MSPRPLVRAVLVAALTLLLPAVICGWLLHALGAPLPWLLAPGLVLAAAAMGRAVRQAYIIPARLAEAEVQWASGHSAQEVLKTLSRAVRPSGELAFRIGLLRTAAYLSLGHRTQAWQASMEGQLLRFPAWSRWAVLHFLARANHGSIHRAIALGEKRVRRNPRNGRLKHILGLLYLSRNAGGDAERSWQLFQEALPCASEDVLLLEDLALAALDRLQGLPSGRKDESLESFFESGLRQLLHRHGDPRLAWNRVDPARHLLQTGRPEWVLALAHSLPFPVRSPELWELQVAALRDMGDSEGAWQAVEESLAAHPASFRLHMERHELALERRQIEVAASELEAAGRLLEGCAENDARRHEWVLRLAEYAYWEQGDAQRAWDLLATVPEEFRGDEQPPLVLELMVALGKFEDAYRAVQPLLTARPEDVELLLIQGECLAGMDAWEALLAFLESQKDTVRTRADYWNLLGLAETHLGQHATSRDHLERAAFMAPDAISFILDAGHACMELGEWDRAAHHWRQALRLDDRNEEALIQLAETRRLLHDREGAKRYLRECLLHHPESQQAQQYLAELEAN